MVKDALDKIVLWLTKNADRIVKYSLNPGASDADLDAIGRATKYLPPDFKELYKTFNGQNNNENWGNFFYGLVFLSTDDILNDIKLRAAVDKEWPMCKTDIGIDPGSLFNINWIAIGSDGSRCSLRVDLAPAPGGIYGQVIYVDGEEQVAFVVARSIGSLLQQFAVHLDKGLYFLDPEALEDGHHFIDTVASIDLSDWKMSEKWKHLAI